MKCQIKMKLESYNNTWGQCVNTKEEKQIS